MSTLPFQPYPRSAIEDALQTWLSEHAGVKSERCWWSDGEIVETQWPFAVLTWVTTTPVGMPATGVEALIANPLPPDLAAGVPDVRLWAGQPARVLISAQVFANPDGPPEGRADVRLSAATAMLATSRVWSSLLSAGLSVVVVGGITNVGAGQAQVDLTCEIAQNVFDDITSIQHVTITPEINDVEQPSFTVPDDQPTPPPSTTTIYFGSSAVAIDTAAEVLSLLQPLDVDGFPVSLPLNVAAGQRGFVVVPASAAIDTFVVNGFVGGFIVIANVVVDGVASVIWATAYQSLGPFTVEVSS